MLFFLNSPSVRHDKMLNETWSGMDLGSICADKQISVILLVVVKYFLWSLLSNSLWTTRMISFSCHTLSLLWRWIFLSYPFLVVKMNAWGRQHRSASSQQQKIIPWEKHFFFILLFCNFFSKSFPGRSSAFFVSSFFAAFF